MIWIRSVQALLVMPLLLAQTAPGEQERPTVLLRAEEGFTVLVDAVVTDKKNTVITSLTRDDFVVYEDGVEQEIDTFQLFRPNGRSTAGQPVGRASAPTRDLSTPPEVSKAQALVRDRRNLIIFLLDYATTEFTNQKLVQEASVRYIKNNLTSNDFVAVFVLSAGFRFLQDFTNDPDLLMAALSRKDVSGQALASVGPMLAPPGTASPEPGTAGPTAPAGTAAFGAQAAEMGSQQADIMLAERIQQLFYTMSSFTQKREAYSVLGAIQAISRGVEDIEGRKTLILFSQGFVVGAHMDAELEKTISIANRANVSIYGVDSQGLAAGQVSGSLIPRNDMQAISSAQGRNRILAVGGESLFDRARQVGTDLRDSALRYVSAATGGFAIRNTNDLYLSMERIDEDIRSYYLLSYRPRNVNFDGNFRTIRVEVKKKDLEVRSRSGYLAIAPGQDFVSPEESQWLAQAREGKLDMSLPADFRVSRFYSESETVDVLLSLELWPDEIQFLKQTEPENGTLTANLAIIGLVRDESGRSLARFGTPVNLHLQPDELEVLRQGSIGFTNQMQLIPGVYSFEVVVYDRQTRRASRKQQSLLIAPPRPGMSLSSIVLGKQVEQDNGMAVGLTYEGTRILPSASGVFKKSDRLIYFFRVSGIPPGPSTEKLKVRISVSPAGSRTEFKLPEYLLTGDGGSSMVSSKFLELENLAPGHYFLNVEVTDAGGQNSVRGRANFEIAG